MVRRLAFGLLLAGAAFTCDSQTLRYSDRRDALLDVQLPEGGGPFRAVVAVHGGGWRGGSRADVQPFCRTVLEAGLACVSVDYRLAPASRFPAQIDDLIDVIRFLRANAERLRIDTGGVILAGESAGGHLVSWLALRDGPTVAIPILGVVAFAPPLDLIALAEPGRKLGIIPPEIRDLLGISSWAEEAVAQMRTASPISLVRPGAPSFLLIHGDADYLVPLRSSPLFCEAMRSTGSDCRFVRIPGARHGLWNEDQFERWRTVWGPTFTAWVRGLLER